MKTYFLMLVSLFSLLFLAGCEKEVDDVIESEKPGETPGNEESGVVPEGYFEVTFSPGTNDTRAAVAGPDGRVRHLRYIIYNSTTGAFVKEKVVLTTASGTASWPLPAVKDTLLKGSYMAVFLGNVEKTLFPYDLAGGGQGYSDILTNYQSQMADARITLPNGQMSDTSEYYWAKVPFSDGAAHPTILLQRVISLFKLHRNFVDAQDALNKLTDHVVANVNAGNIIENQVNATLPGLVRSAFNNPLLAIVLATVGGLDSATNKVTRGLLGPLTTALHDLLLKNIVNQLGGALTGNTNHQGAIDGLGALLNPWNNSTAHTAVITLRNFPRTIDFDHVVHDYYIGDQHFQYDFPQTSIYDEKDVLIRGLNGTFDVREIRITNQTLVGGLLIDNIVDSPYLLNGVFVNVMDPILQAIPSNRRYKDDYSFVDLNYQSGTATSPLPISVSVGSIANIDNILENVPLVGPLLTTTLSLALSPLKAITITVPLNVPLLGADKLTLSGSWATPTTY